MKTFLATCKHVKVKENDSKHISYCRVNIILCSIIAGKIMDQIDSL